MHAPYTLRAEQSREINERRARQTRSRRVDEKEPCEMLRPSAAPVRTSRACRGRLPQIVVAVVALLACLAQAAAQQPVAPERIVVDQGDMVLVKNREEAAAGNSTVRGRAVFEETGRPVRRAHVMLVLEHSTPGAGVSAQGLTNARGEFEFKDVRAGHYFVAVLAPGVLTPFSFGVTTVATVDSTPM